ncbi:CGNR zinc finger domain-containing protein [Glycomyces buryatensis]|uniref:Zinc finger CGNR domain-containing protein n=1 Tax=Glycomyces buryatensis TaxID=2570927 RepID=A0A4V4HSE0_9ACTN|nr:ABATE domain-containing protein [Glycomyces buryatensis]THV41186.1 hypothetical protein FAB82_13130 [Glycomyces buryatensis]
MNASEPLVGEPLAVDLVNTRPVGQDLLATTGMLASWLALEADRLPGLEVDRNLTDDDLEAVHRVRECIANALAALMNGQHPPKSALDGLNRALAAAPATRRLEWVDGAVVAGSKRAGTSAEWLAAMLAESAADLLTDPSISKLRRCEADDCVMLFLPAHPRRRWCAPERCGNRARVARYYQRHKE